MGARASYRCGEFNPGDSERRAAAHCQDPPPAVAGSRAPCSVLSLQYLPPGPKDPHESPRRLFRSPRKLERIEFSALVDGKCVSSLSNQVSGELTECAGNGDIRVG